MLSVLRRLLRRITKGEEKRGRKEGSCEESQGHCDCLIEQTYGQYTPEVSLALHLVVMMSTTHLGIEFLDSISLSKSSLVRVKLGVIPNALNLLASWQTCIVHLLLSVVASSLQKSAYTITPYLQDIHHVLLVGDHTSDLADQLTDNLRSLRGVLHN